MLAGDWESGNAKADGANKLAERGGFEPPVTAKATPVFKTGPFNRSGTSPRFSTLSARAAVCNRLNREYFAHNK